MTMPEGALSSETERNAEAEMLARIAHLNAELRETAVRLVEESNTLLKRWDVREND